MSDFDDDLINDAFVGFSDAAAPSVRAAGTDAVKQTIKRRRTRNTAALSVLGALLLVVPVTAYASMDRGNQGPPQTGASAEASADPSPATTASPSPSAVPTGPDGRLTSDQVTAAKLDLPEWGWGSNGGVCATRRVRLAKKSSGPVYQVYLGKVVHANLDGDSSLETAALIHCRIGEIPTSQVIALDRDTAGKIVVLGQLVRSSDRMNGILDITADPQGNVAADVSDHQACCNTPKLVELHQTRTYGWNGSAFAQLAGPTELRPHDGLIDLAISVKSVTWGQTKQVKIAATTRPYQTATTVLKVVNKGPVASGEWMVLLGDSGQAEALSGIGQVRPALAAGATVEVTVTFRVDQSMFDVGPGIQLWVYELGTIGMGYDRNQDDNRAVAAFPK